MIALYDLLAGICITAVLHTWLHLLPGSFWVITGALSLAIFSISSLIGGLYSSIGPRGLVLGIGYTLLIANPITGLILPPEFILEPWGIIGQLLAPGASATLLRNVTYFPTADNTFPLIIAICWSLLGASLLLLGKQKNLLEDQ